MDAPLSTKAREVLELGSRESVDHDRSAALAAFEAATELDPLGITVKIERAKELRALDRLDEAEAQLDDVLNMEPGELRALIERGHLFRGRGDRERAAGAFRTAAAVDPRNWNIQVELARDLRALDRLDEADVVLNNILDAEPRHPWALIERGLILRQRGKHEEAASAFKTAATSDPSNRNVEVEFARSLLALNRLDEADEVLSNALAAEPCHIGALKERGHLARRRGDGAAALRYFSSANECDPNNLDLRLDLAAELREQGDFNGALRLIQSVLDTNADHWDAWMQLGQLCRVKRDPKGAMNAFRTAVAKQPSKPQGLVELAHETWEAGQPNEAQQILKQALAAEPNHLGALLVSAEFALQAERPDEALQLAQRAIRFHPRKLGSYLLAARAAGQALKREQALNILEQARAVFGPLPELVAAHIHILRHFREFNAVRALIAGSREQIAANFPLWLESTSFAVTVGEFEVAERALALAPAISRRELAHVHFLRAQIAEGRRQYAKAISHYQEALTLDPDSGHWHGALARAFLLQADIGSARTHLRAAFDCDKAKRLSASQTFNITQHHTGQLINEFVLVRGVLARLKQIVALPHEQQIEPLKRLAHENPDHTAPALLLMLAMRNSRAFSTLQVKPASVTPPKIPQQIVQYWHSNVLPDDISALMRSWSDAHSDYKHIVLNDETADNFLRANYRDEICRTFHRAREPGQRADILRLAYLASEGGYFVDADDKCLARLDSFVPPQAEFAGYQDNYGAIGSNFIGAVAGHPVIALALENAVRAVNRGDRDISWLSTGPGLLTRSFAQVLSVAETDWLSRVHLLELWELQRVVGIYSPAHYKRPNVVKTSSSGETNAAQLPAKGRLRATISKIEMSRK